MHTATESADLFTAYTAESLPSLVWVLPGVQDASNDHVPAFVGEPRLTIEIGSRR